MASSSYQSTSVPVGEELLAPHAPLNAEEAIAAESDVQANAPIRNHVRRISVC